MADSKLLVPELNEAETMGAETARFEELLLQVRTDRDFWVPWGIFFFRNGTTVPIMHYGSNRAYGHCSCLTPSLLGSGINGSRTGVVFWVLQ